MGTRSLTHIKDSEGQTLLTLYRQFDGYLSGMGQDLFDFIQSGTVVNGIPCGTDVHYFNGMGDFAVQVIAHLKIQEAKHEFEMWGKNKLTKFNDLKLKAGNLYIYPPNAEDCWEEYTYVIKPSSAGDKIELFVMMDDKSLVSFEDAVKKEKEENDE